MVEIWGGLKKLFKKYLLKCQYCGSYDYKYEWLLKLRLIFTNRIYYHCRVCHHTTSYLNSFHLRHDSMDKKEKEFNRSKLFDDRIWKDKDSEKR